MTPEDQIGQALAVASRHLGDRLVAACLYGSATAGGLRRWSDVDLLITVSARPPASRCSGRWPPAGCRSRDRRARRHRPLEATVLALPTPAPGTGRRGGSSSSASGCAPTSVRGVFEPPQPDPDLALLIAQARADGRALIGPPPAALFDPVPLSGCQAGDRREPAVSPARLARGLSQRSPDTRPDVADGGDRPDRTQGLRRGLGDGPPAARGGRLAGARPRRLSRPVRGGLDGNRRGGSAGRAAGLPKPRQRWPIRRHEKAPPQRGLDVVALGRRYSAVAASPTISLPVSWSTAFIERRTLPRPCRSPGRRPSSTGAPCRARRSPSA